MVGFGLDYACAHIIIPASVNLLPIQADFVTERVMGGSTVNELFNRKDRKFMKRNGHRRRKKHSVRELTSRLENFLREYKSRFSVFHIRSLVLSLPVKWMSLVWSIFECWRQDNEVPDRVAVLL